MNTHDQERRPARILIVEDEALLVRQLSYTLRSLGYEVAGAFAAGEEAVQAVDDFHPDLILMDIMLQGNIDGIEAAERIRRRFDIPVIFITGYSETDVLERAKKAEPYGYLSKPVSETDLRSTIETVLHKHRADKRVIESEERYRSLYTRTPAMLHSIDMEGRLVSVSDRWLEVMGYERDEVIGRRSTEFLTEESRRKAEDVILPKFYLEGFLKDASYQFVKKNGEIIEVLLSATAEYDSEGRFVRSLAVLEDVTERKKAEKALRQERDKAARYLEAARVMMLAVDREGNVTLVNRKTCEVLGWEEHEIVGADWFDNFLPQRDRDRVYGVFAQIMSGEVGPFEYYENPIVTSTGEERLIAWHNTFVRDDSGLVVSLLTSGEDITEKKQAADQLRIEKERAERYLNTAGVIMVALDREGRVTLINRKGCEVLGYGAEEIVGRSCFDTYLPKSDRKRTKELFAQLIAGGVEPARYFENPVVTRNGEERLIAWYNQIFTDEDANIIGTLSSGEDITDRRKAEEALRASETRYRRLFDNSPVGIISVDTEGSILEVNPKLVEILGSPSADATKAINMFTFPPLRDSGFSAAFEKCMKTGESFSVEGAYRSKWGKETYLRVLLNPMIGETGTVRGCQGVIEDITERKKAEEDHREVLELMRYIVENDPNAIAVYDRNLYYIAVSKRYLLDYKVKEDDIIGRHHYEVFPEMPQRWKDAHQRCLAGAVESEDDDYFERPDGSITYNRWECRPWYTSNGEIGGIITYTEVTTERKLAEKALKESEERYRQLVDNANEAIFVVQDGRFKFVNRRSSEMSGFTRDELLSMSFTDLIHQEDREKVLSFHRRRLEGDDGQFTFMFRFVDRDGHVRWVNLNSANILWQGRPAGLCCLSDITEIKKAEELAITSEKLKAVGELAGGVAHNFNNLLQIVLGCSQLALTDLELGNVTRARDNLEQIVESSRFGAQTVKRLQDFARVRRDDLAVRIKVFDLADTVDEAIEMSKPWWKTKPEKNGVAITLNRYVRKGCLVKGNENELFEVIVNLIKNAAEALDKGGELRIRTSVDDDTAVLTVEDNGVGIPEENLGRVFAPFWTTKGPQGTGMGLSSSYGIVQRHGGEIAVESERGEGTSFTVRLPLSAEQPKPRERPVRRTVSFELNVLIVDDMPAVIKQLEGGLSSYGQTVYSASSGPVALEIFRETPIDVVICDLAMPEMNGWQVGEEIRRICEERQTAKPIFIMLTGWGGQIHEEDKMLQSGVDMILEKPVDIGKLSEVIEELIKKREAAEE